MKALYKQLRYTLPVSIAIFIILQLVWVASGMTIRWNTNLLVVFLYVTLYTVCLQAANILVFTAIARAFNAAITAKRFIIGFLSSVAVSLVVIFLLRVFEDVVIEKTPFALFIEQESVVSYYFATAVSVIVLLIVHLLYFYKKYQENRVKEQKIIAGTASAKFESLKNQIDPHFLFNSLNVLSSLIEENPENAQRFTTSLSKVYRYVLEQKDKELVSVNEELAFAKTYMNLLKMRFENSLTYEIPPIAFDDEARVVPLSLQLLLENTVKHNVVSPGRPLNIKIYEDNGNLAVQNNYQKKAVLQDRQGVGLQNIIDRYAIVTSRKVTIHQSTEHFTVQIPILTKQITIMENNFSNENSSYYKAQKRVEKIRGFYGNLTSYAAVILVLMILNLATSPKYLWFLWPAFGWGIGVAFHGMSVFNYLPFLGSDWEERKIREIMEKENRRKEY